ncbi:MAG: SDR family oxidoreductase [Exilibacterium sp.]
MKPKVAVITGASTGLGFSLALQMASQGITTYATMRDFNKKRLLESFARRKKLDINITPLDVANPGDVSTCIEGIIAEEGRLDYLINNAGVGYFGALEFLTEDEFDKVFSVNVKGAFFCTQAVLPQMRQQKSGRIVNISSVCGLVGMPFQELYSASKFAIEGFTEALASYLQPEFNIHFTLVEAGQMSTEFGHNAIKNSTLTKVKEYKEILKKIQRRSKIDKFAHDSVQSADLVAEQVMLCLLQERPPLRFRTSDWAEQMCKFKTQADPDGKQQYKALCVE